MSEEAAPRLAYQPALDGLRAVAVALVVVFHGGFAWLSGGYVGVSVFFTLSGYLITSLLIAEFDGTGSIALRSFYAKRVRRLLPASLLVLAAVAGISAAGGFAGVAGLRRDLLGSLLQVENWVKLSAHSSYADLTAGVLGKVGPLEHYWSLAIEEQFYWVWPVVMLVALARLRRPLARLIALAALGVVSTVAAFVIAARWGADAAYWATPARLGEIVVGATVAALVAWRPVLPRRTRWLGPPALAIIVVAALTWPATGGPAYRGWLPVFALATAALLVALQHPSALRTGLSSRPLVWIGGISYGIYLIHWPVHAWLVGSGIGGSRGTVFLLTVVITLVLAALSARLVERPVRRWSGPPRAALLAGLGAASACALFIVATVAGPVSAQRREALAGIDPANGTLAPLVVATTTTTTTTTTTVAATSTSMVATATTSTSVASTTTEPVATTTTAPTLPALSRPVRIMVVGDSTAEALGDGFDAWAAANPAVARVKNDGQPGCGLFNDGTDPTDGTTPWKRNCVRHLTRDVPADLSALRPDVVVLMVTLRDVQDRTFPGVDGLQTPFDEPYVSRLRAAYAAVAEQLLGAGVDHIAWLLAPYPSVAFSGDQEKMRDPQRYQVLAGVIRDVAAAHPGQISVVDLDAWLHAQGRIDDPATRRDGLHLNPDAATEVVSVYVGPTVVNAAVGSASG